MDIAQLISNVGFPIFSFIVTGLACKYVYDKESKRNDLLIGDNMEKLEQLTLAVNNNTAVLQQMVTEVHERIHEKESE